MGPVVRRASADVPAEVRSNAITSLREFGLNERARRTEHIRVIADQIGVDERTVWRWLQAAEAEGRIDRRQRPRLEITEQDVHDLAYHRGNIAAFLRARSISVPTYSHETWRVAFRRALSPGRHIGLRLGERGRRELDTYLTRNPRLFAPSKHDLKSSPAAVM